MSQFSPATVCKRPLRTRIRQLYFNHYFLSDLSHSGSQLDVSPPTTVSLPTGRSISLLCGGTTMNRINLPQFTWTRNSTTIPTGLSRISVQQSRYAITSLLVKDTQIGDSGTYRCNGVNPANNISASTRVIIAGMN